ncbi:MAG: OadG family protein [Bacteroidales bacterium]|nr:OadG family protein [Bacteroidales bacterium]
MTTYLFNFLLTAGGDRMMQTDPHGWTLTLISVTVVFSALTVLYFVYSLSGSIFSGKFKRTPKPKKGTADAEVAAAIALALDMECSGDEYAAIATAVHLYLNDAIHDVEPGIVTIVRKESGWNNKELNFRKLPR